MATGKMASGLIFGDKAPDEVLTTQTVSQFDFIQVGSHVLRSALNAFSTFSYEGLHGLYPGLKSCAEFVSSEDYLAKLQVKVMGKYASLTEYSQADRLYIAKDVLRQLEPLLRTRGKSYRGTKTSSLSLSISNSETESCKRLRSTMMGGKSLVVRRRILQT